MHCIFETAFHPRCHLRKIVIHSFLPSKNVLRANVPSHFRFKWRQPFYTKIAICGHPPRGHDINLSRPPTNPYHLPEIAISWVGKIGFCILECRRNRWGFLLATKYAHAWQMKLLFNFQDLPWAQCLKNSNATFWVIFKHCGIHLKSYSCSLKPFKAVSVRLLYSE